MSPEKIIELALKAYLAFDSEEYPDIWQLYMDVGREEIIAFANLVAQLERERIATSIERLPFGDTAASFAIYVRELKDD
jgi:hypothetical protein